MIPFLTDLAPDEIAQTLELKPFQGKQIFRWLHQKRVFDFDAMTDLSKDLRKRLETIYGSEKETCGAAAQLRLVRLASSPKSGTRKALFRLRDGESIESVFLVDRDRLTLCLSSQVGCALKCPFCATGQSGFRRNLRAGEVVEQALHLLSDQPLGDRTPNIVFMGMGEPFRNYDAVMKSIRLLMHPDGLHIGARKITVSTVGDVPGIRRFAQEAWQVRLAVSLQAANDKLRSKLVPLNRTYPVAMLMEAVREYAGITGRQLSLEWTLFDGVNDSAEHAAELADLIGGLDAVVNLIPYNPVQGLPYEPSPKWQCQAFRDALAQRGVKATLRHERGQDIDAACGQLRLRHTDGIQDR
jgi:23S rRNA (adenine2503-C2)-methyltransferase